MAKKNEKTKRPEKAEKFGKAIKNDALSGLKNVDMILKEYDLPKEGLTPNVIMHKMSEILELYLKIIQQILQPEEFHAAYECAEFNEKDKTDLFDLYKRIIILHRELLKAVLIADEKNSLSTIQFAHTEMQSFKPTILEVLTKMQKSWKMDDKKDEHKGTKQYFG